MDVPLAGVDLAFTCTSCIRRNTRKGSVLDHFRSLCSQSPVEALPRSHSGPVPSCYSLHDYASGAFSATSTPVGTPSSSPRSSSSSCSVVMLAAPSDTCRVVVSQHRTTKLQSVCSLLSDYLECVGGAIALVDGGHVWILAQKGLKPPMLHSDAFLAV